MNRLTKPATAKRAKQTGQGSQTGQSGQTTRGETPPPPSRQLARKRMTAAGSLLDRLSPQQLSRALNSTAPEVVGPTR